MGNIYYHIHGDNIVECDRTFEYVCRAIGASAGMITGPSGSVTCPAYEVSSPSGDRLHFTFLPGFGERRWNQDILGFVQGSGGRLREAADAIVTVVNGEIETPLFAMEFCGALPAGNNAWQRQGRAFSYAHARIPYFFLAELGGYELTAERSLKAERLPNPAVPFSFFSMTHYSGAVCLPVYEANSGARPETIARFGPIFGRTDFLDYIRLILANAPTAEPVRQLSKKCVGLVELLSATGRNGMSQTQWRGAQKAVEAGESLTAYLTAHAPISWRKVAYIEALTPTTRQFMEFGKECTLGLTSNALPLSFVPRARRREFADGLRNIYGDVDDAFTAWLASANTDLAIAWVMGFKPRGDDARPDRGLPPLARMLVGDKTDLMTFVYGPAPVSHWNLLARDPGRLAAQNGLWEAAMGVSDALLLDSAMMQTGSPRALLKSTWAAAFPRAIQPLNVNPVVRSPSEHDVDTALHVLFASLGSDVVFEGMCNPPGGDWSGVSFIWSKDHGEHRWLTLPRVSADNAKRPDHVFAIFGLGSMALCLCVESKERPSSLESMIGPRLISYTSALFGSAPSILRRSAAESWGLYNGDWAMPSLEFASMGAYIANPAAPFDRVRDDTGVDILCGIEFLEDASKCIAHVRALTATGRRVLAHIIAGNVGNAFIEFKEG